MSSDANARRGRRGVLMDTDNALLHPSTSRVPEHNNNNTIWRGSVLTGEEPPPHAGELNHALSQVGGPTQSQLSRLMSSRHRISMEHRLRKKPGEWVRDAPHGHDPGSTLSESGGTVAGDCWLILIEFCSLKRVYKTPVTRVEGRVD